MAVRGMLVGCIVADAAALGYEWLYDTERLRAVCTESGGEPAFHAPCAADYDGVMGYFIGKNKHIGDASPYGEHAACSIRAVRSLSGDDQHSANSFVTAFHRELRSSFDYGGTWVGYVDRAISGTLNNLHRVEMDAQSELSLLEFSGEKNDRSNMITKAKGAFAKYGSDIAAVRDYTKRAVLETHSGEMEDECVAFAMHVVEVLAQAGQGKHMGEDDNQVSAFSKLPALVTHLSACEGLSREDRFKVYDAAIQATNANEQAVSLGMCAAAMLEAALREGSSVEDVLQAAVAAAKDGETLKLVQAGIERRNESQEEVAAALGKSCLLGSSFPCIVHAVARGEKLSYAGVIRANILAGGDSCGRGVVIGAILGALKGIGTGYGVPAAWVDATRSRQSALMELVESCGSAT